MQARIVEHLTTCNDSEPERHLRENLLAHTLHDPIFPQEKNPETPNDPLMATQLKRTNSLFYGHTIPIGNYLTDITYWVCE